MRKPMFALISVLVMVIAGLLLSACAPSTPVVKEVVKEVPKEVVVTPTPAPPKPVSLKMWIMPNGPDPAGAIRTELDAFEKLHPNVKVQAEVLDWGAAWPKLTTAATSGEGPDVSQLGTTWVAAISSMGALRPFTQAEIAAMGGGKAFVEASWKTGNPIGSGFTTAIPWFVDVRAVVYRKDLLSAAGVDPKTAFASWESFDAALAKLQAANKDVAAFAYPGKNDWNVLHNFAPWVWGAGGDMLNPGNTAAVFNSQEGVAGVKFYASLYTKGYAPKEALELNSAQVEGLFSSGKVAMVIAGPWMIKGARTPQAKGGWAESEAAKNLAVAEIPTGGAGRFTFVGGSNLAVWNSSKNPTEAVELVKFLAAKESQIRYGNNIGMLPALKDALTDPSFAKDPDYSVFITASEHGKSYPAIAAWGPLETAMVKNLGLLWDDVAGVNGPFNPDKMIPGRLDAAAKEVNLLLAAGK